MKGWRSLGIKHRTLVQPVLCHWATTTSHYNLLHVLHR